MPPPPVPRFTRFVELCLLGGEFASFGRLLRVDGEGRVFGRRSGAELERCISTGGCSGAMTVGSGCSGGIMPGSLVDGEGVGDGESGGGIVNLDKEAVDRMLRLGGSRAGRTPGKITNGWGSLESEGIRWIVGDGWRLGIGG